MSDFELELDFCIICTESFRGRTTVRLGCGHRFCADCIRQLVKLEGGNPRDAGSQRAKCPLCRRSIDESRVAKGRARSRWMRAVMYVAGGVLAAAGAYLCRYRILENLEQYGQMLKQ